MKIGLFGSCQLHLCSPFFLNDKVTKINKLNPNITILDNPLGFLKNLRSLGCTNNQITSIDNIPTFLKELVCYSNPLIYTFAPTLENIRNYNNS